jgi:hypothetical protein
MKTKKEVTQQLLEKYESEILVLELNEKFLSQQTVIATSGKGAYQMQLGQTQSTLKESRKFVEFLKKELNESN